MVIALTQHLAWPLLHSPVTHLTYLPPASLPLLRPPTRSPCYSLYIFAFLLQRRVYPCVNGPIPPPGGKVMGSQVVVGTPLRWVTLIHSPTHPSPLPLPPLFLHPPCPLYHSRPLVCNYIYLLSFSWLQGMRFSLPRVRPKVPTAPGEIFEA